jgi:hypothetical protein
LEVAPVAELYVPMGHLVHTVCPVSVLYWPAGQGPQAAAVVPPVTKPYRPVGQATGQPAVWELVPVTDP